VKSKKWPKSRLDPFGTAQSTCRRPEWTACIFTLCNINQSEKYAKLTMW